jgi:hypothetical protein
MARLVSDAIPETTGTKRRRLDVISAVAGLREFNLSLPNPFAKLKIRGEGLDATRRVPFTPEELAVICKVCVSLDDDLRWSTATPQLFGQPVVV